MNLENKLHKILIEGLNFQKRPSRGNNTTIGYIPAEFAKNEPEVEIEFDWSNDEPQTHDYPGSQGGVFINKITITDTGQELDIDQIPDELRKHFEEIAMNSLADQDNRALGDYEDSLDARRDEMPRRRF